jgi:site-specific recombinase XerD
MSDWTEIVAEYGAVLQQEGRSEMTLQLTSRWLDRFVAFAVRSGADTVHQVTSKHLAAFQSELWWHMGDHGQLYSANSRFQCLQMVRAFLRWAHDTGRIAKDPSTGLVLRRPAERHEPLLTADEVATFFAHPVRLNAHRI